MGAKRLKVVKSESGEIPTQCPICERSTMIGGGLCYGCGLEIKDFDNEVMLAQIQTSGSFSFFYTKMPT